MIPASLPVIADFASIASAILQLGKEFTNRGAYLHNANTNVFPSGVVVSRRDWQPTTMTERIRDYLTATKLPDFPRITEDMRLF